MKIDKTALTIALSALVSFSAVADTTYDDAAVSREFLRTTRFFCGNGDPVGSSLRWILSTCCGNDTNRYVRVAKETATTNSTFSGEAIGIVLRHGAVNDIPFLCRYTNETDNAYLAGIGVVKLGGVTTNTLAVIADFLAVPDNTSVEQDLLAEAIMRHTLNSECPTATTQMAQGIVMNFARKSIGVRRLDAVLRECDPTYTYSKRRLSVLRSASVLNLIDMQRDYTTNAINELVAYPESALPD